MSLPQKRRGFRRIVVDGIAYDWRCDKRIDIRRSDVPRGSLTLDIIVDPWLQISEPRLQRNSSPITPSFIAHAIQRITQLGWQPKDYVSCIATYEGGEFSLEIADQNSQTHS